MRPAGTSGREPTADGAKQSARASAKAIAHEARRDLRQGADRRWGEAIGQRARQGERP
ncbi:hypothetical protein [Paenibacillus sp. JJ-223]|uniref:hypothetical protein n=1 Tax=Paenibacillus sp. JJ-223 TaxID=2905647 RepID=UPI001F420922|nr:hypothetical protein [Paenibacillus sp. JJ-223]